MPRYFFDIDDGDTSTEDDEGVEFSDLQEARDRAIGVLPNIARDILPDGDRRDFVITVKDACGKPIFRATLAFQAEWLVPREHQ